MYESLRFRCLECEEVFDDLVERADRDKEQICPNCGERAAIRTFAPPTIRTSDSATYLDGTNRFGKIKETWKLRQAKARAKEQRNRHEEKRIQTEITKLNK